MQCAGKDKYLFFDIIAPLFCKARRFDVGST